MTKEELEDYMTNRMLLAAGATVRAAQLHFCDGHTVVESARRAGIHKVTASKAIVEIRKRMEEDGWKHKRIERIVYYQ